MKRIIEDWERSAKKYRELGLKATDPRRVEGLLCRSEVYDCCADKLRRFFQQVVEVDAQQCARCGKPYNSEFFAICLDCRKGRTA